MPNQTVIDPSILEAALEGLQLKQQRIDEQLAQIRRLLGRRLPGRPKKAGEATPDGAQPKRTFSAAARRRMAAAQKKRWAEAKKAQKTK